MCDVACLLSFLTWFESPVLLELTIPAVPPDLYSLTRVIDEVELHLRLGVLRLMDLRNFVVLVFVCCFNLVKVLSFDFQLQIRVAGRLHAPLLVGINR